ncbi:hypothetical protein [Singulisphaera sp. GP187]|uniref:hypothetical protein n=1 Tax=Singulisphaera sp. GP187 TaxID=1882752 RepID=UPI0011610914|nr:hypothetical protein [Singulisphaera sp. GP187]
MGEFARQWKDGGIVGSGRLNLVGEISHDMELPIAPEGDLPASLLAVPWDAFESGGAGLGRSVLLVLGVHAHPEIPASIVERSLPIPVVPHLAGFGVQ